jgi:hypothetical protein
MIGLGTRINVKTQKVIGVRVAPIRRGTTLLVDGVRCKVTVSTRRGIWVKPATHL